MPQPACTVMSAMAVSVIDISQSNHQNGEEAAEAPPRLQPTCQRPMLLDEMMRFLQDAGIGEAAAMGYAAALVNDGFDTVRHLASHGHECAHALYDRPPCGVPHCCRAQPSAFGELSAQELEDDFHFKRGHLRMVDRYRKERAGERVDSEGAGNNSADMERTDSELARRQRVVDLSSTGVIGAAHEQHGPSAPAPSPSPPAPPSFPECLAVGVPDDHAEQYRRALL